MKTIYSTMAIIKALHHHREFYYKRRENVVYSGGYGDGGYSHAMELQKVFITVWDNEELPLDRIPDFLKEFLVKADIEITKESLKNNPEFIKAKELAEKYKQFL